jgi:ABC-2 type transport system ATP-binding protein
MKQRLHLARGMIGDPKLLILDEPTTGMDPVSALDFRSMIADLRNEGRSILLTTHDMREAEAVCDRVSLIDQGRLLATEDPRAIGSWLAIYGRVTAENVSIETESIMRDLPGVLSVSRDGDSVLIEVGAEGAMRDVLRFLVADGITCLATGQPSLEEFYLAKIGNRGLAVR